MLVAAPTGSGKTVVAEHAVDLALAGGGKAFYTTPIKALSNQKFGDLVRRHGAERVGLLTGDNAINGDAPVVVMTTEVLRNMIYAAVAGARRPPLRRARRGALPPGPLPGPGVGGGDHPPAAATSAWCASRRRCRTPRSSPTGSRPCAGRRDAVIEDQRPVELVNLYLVGDKGSHRAPPAADAGRRAAQPRGAPVRRRVARGARGRPTAAGPRRRFFTPDRVEVVDRLADDDLLPAIYFIFSRAACDDAVAAVPRRRRAPHRRPTSASGSGRSSRSAPPALSDADLGVLGYGRVARRRSRPASPRTTPAWSRRSRRRWRRCFADGLVKVVFATETLALGINMPARTVVIEKLTKFTGERHEFLTPGEYTQLTGRAGRRGIDAVGYAVVLWSPFVPFDQVAALAASRSVPR